jgi:hypothetical protein
MIPSVLYVILVLLELSLGSERYPLTVYYPMSLHRLISFSLLYMLSSVSVMQRVCTKYTYCTLSSDRKYVISSCLDHDMLCILNLNSLCY